MKSFLLLAFAASAAANISVSRTLSQVLSGTSGTVTVGPDGTCASSDQYGSNDCTMNWGSNYTATWDATLPQAIDAGATIEVDATIDMLLPWKFTCAACGADCVITVPVVGKTITIPAAPCPLVAAGHLSGSKTLPLPSPSPVPLGVSFKGTVTLKAADGTVWGAAAINGKVAP